MLMFATITAPQITSSFNLGSSLWMERGNEFLLTLWQGQTCQPFTIVSSIPCTLVYSIPWWEKTRTDKGVPCFYPHLTVGPTVKVTHSYIYVCVYIYIYVYVCIHKMQTHDRETQKVFKQFTFYRLNMWNQTQAKTCCDVIVPLDQSRWIDYSKMSQYWYLNVKLAIQMIIWPFFVSLYTHAYLIMCVFCVTRQPGYVRISQPKLQRGQWSSVRAVRLAGGLLRRDAVAVALLPSLRSISVFLLLLLFRPPLVFGQEDVKGFPSAWDSSTVG